MVYFLRTTKKRSEKMKLSRNSIKKLIFGAYQFKENAGYLEPYRFSDEQIDLYKVENDVFYKRIINSGGLTLEFKTNAESFGFDYYFPVICSWDTIDVYVNGEMTASAEVHDLAEEKGKRKGHVDFTLPEGNNKKVCVYFPCESTMFIKNLVINGSYSAVKKDKKPKVLWLGDSITQGYGSHVGSLTYVHVANRILDWDVLNQGIGGYGFFSRILTKLDYSPDKIIVAFGTNDKLTPYFKQNVETFVKTLTEMYKDVPVLLITPIWRPDMTGIPEAREHITFVAGKYKNVSVVPGDNLVPNAKPFIADVVHPNSIGCEYYGTRLVKAIKEMKF